MILRSDLKPYQFMIKYQFVRKVLFMDKLAEIRTRLAEAAHKDSVSDDMKLNELGLDSLDVVELLLKLEEEYNVHFDDVDMSNLNTVKDLLDAISSQLK